MPASHMGPGEGVNNWEHGRMVKSNRQRATGIIAMTLQLTIGNLSAEWHQEGPWSYEFAVNLPSNLSDRTDTNTQLVNIHNTLQSLNLLPSGTWFTAQVAEAWRTGSPKCLCRIKSHKCGKQGTLSNQAFLCFEHQILKQPGPTPQGGHRNGDTTSE